MAWPFLPCASVGAGLVPIRANLNCSGEKATFNGRWWRGSSLLFASLPEPDNSAVEAFRYTLPRYEEPTSRIAMPPQTSPKGRLRGRVTGLRASSPTGRITSEYPVMRPERRSAHLPTARTSEPRSPFTQKDVTESRGTGQNRLVVYFGVTHGKASDGFHSDSVREVCPQV